VQEHAWGVVIAPSDVGAHDSGALTEKGMRARKMLESHFTRQKGSNDGANCSMRWSSWNVRGERPSAMLRSPVQIAAGLPCRSGRLPHRLQSKECRPRPFHCDETNFLSLFQCLGESRQMMLKVSRDLGKTSVHPMSGQP
jgi:hypothetical protein